jgi:general secretion pathway protein E
VLSTLHTNDSASAIIRLLDLGVQPFLISES